MTVHNCRNERRTAIDLPTARDYLKSSVRLIIWCKAMQAPDRDGVEEDRRHGKGDVPVVKLRFRCENCGSG